MNSAISVLEDHIPDFQDRVIFIYLKGKNSSYGQYIVGPRMEMQAGRLFLAGTTPRGDEPIGNPICVSWDAVETYIVGNSEDEFKSIVTSPKESSQEG